MMDHINANQFREVYRPTIGADFMMKHVEINENIYRLQIWDTAGQEKFSSLNLLYSKGAKGVLVCFDLSSKESLLGL